MQSLRATQWHLEWMHEYSPYTRHGNLVRLHGMVYTAIGAELNTLAKPAVAPNL